jgi:drug/metabolite transporter (DMT)-like permease
MPKFADHTFLFASLLLNGISQIIMRWQMEGVTLPDPIPAKLLVAARLLLKPWVMAAAAITLASAVCWMITLSKFELSYAYPWTAALYAYMLAAGCLLFGEVVTPMKILGTAVIVLGVVIVTR